MIYTVGTPVAAGNAFSTVPSPVSGTWIRIQIRATPPAGTPQRQRVTADSGAASPIVSDWHGKCIDVPGANYADRVRMRVWDCWNGPQQRFELAGDGTIRIGGKCLDVADGSTADLATVRIFGCNGTPAQQWVLTGRQASQGGACRPLGGRPQRATPSS